MIVSLSTRPAGGMRPETPMVTISMTEQQAALLLRISSCLTTSTIRNAFEMSSYDWDVEASRVANYHFYVSLTGAGVEYQSLSLV